MAELLPCPFCGGSAYIERDYDQLLDYVGCDGCSVMVYVLDMEDAIKSWNKRASSKTLIFMNKDYLFQKDPNGHGLLIEIDGVNVLLPTYVIKRLLGKDGEN